MRRTVVAHQRRNAFTPLVAHGPIQGEIGCGRTPANVADPAPNVFPGHAYHHIIPRSGWSSQRAGLIADAGRCLNADRMGGADPGNGCVRRQEPSDKAAMMKKLFNVTRAQRFRRVDNVAIAISLQTLKCSTMLVSGLPRSAAATAKSCKMLLRLSTGPAWLRLRNYVWDGRSRGLRFRTGMTRCPLAVYLCEHLFKMGWFPSPEYTEQATTLTEQYCSHLAGGVP